MGKQISRLEVDINKPTRRQMTQHVIIYLHCLHYSTDDTQHSSVDVQCLPRCIGKSCSVLSPTRCNLHISCSGDSSDEHCENTHHVEDSPDCLFSITPY